MSDNIIKTEIKLSEESVKRIIVSETLKALSQVDNFMENLISQMLFSRPPKRNSYDKEPLTFFETAIQNAFKPMLQEEITVLAEKQRKQIRDIIVKVFKAKVVDSKEFEDILIKQLSKFVSNIHMYVADR